MMGMMVTAVRRGGGGDVDHNGGDNGCNVTKQEGVDVNETHVSINPVLLDMTHSLTDLLLRVSAVFSDKNLSLQLFLLLTLFLSFLLLPAHLLYHCQ